MRSNILYCNIVIRNCCNSKLSIFHWTCVRSLSCFFYSQKSPTDFSILLGLIKMPTVMPDGDASFNAKADVDAVVSAVADLWFCHTASDAAN